MRTTIINALKVCILPIMLFIISITTKAQNASFNYSTSTGSLGSTYSWIDCSGGSEITDSDWSTSGSYSAYDDGYYNVNFPFSFRFYDDNYTTSDQLSICTNGFVRLDGQADDDYDAADYYDLTSSATSLGQIIGLAIADCNTGDASSHVYYKTTGTSPNRIFTIEYDNLEINYNANKYADIEVSFYETSNKVVILFGSDNVSYTSTDMGIHSGVSGYYNKWQNVHNGTNNSWIEYTIPAKSLSSITYNQASTADVAQNSSDNEILRLDFDVTGGSGTLNLNSIVVTSQNTSDADITSSGVKLYRTTTTTFSTVNQLGSSVSFSSGSATFSSLSYDLPGGKTYIWVAFDITSSATKNNHIDASISTNNINVAGSTYPSSNQSPSGYRTITWLEWDGSSSRDWTTGANWSSGSVPTSSDNIVIPSTPSRQPILYSGDNGYCKDITIKSGASVTYQNTSGNLRIYGNLTNNGTLDGSSATKNLQLYGDAKTIGGSGTWTHVLMRVNGGSYSLTDDVTAYKFVVYGSGTCSLGSHKLTVTNDLKLKDAADVLNLNTGTLDLQGNFSDYDGAINANTGTFYYSGATTQTIRNSYTYYNLKIKLTSSSTRSLSSGALSCTNLELTNPSGSSDGTGTLSANLSITGNMTIGTYCKFDANTHNTTVGGNWLNSGTVDLGTTTTTFDGSSAQSISGANTFYNLTVNKSASNLNLSHDITISHTLTLTSGKMSLGSYDMTINSSATVSGGGSSSYIITGGTGVVQKNYSSTGSFTFYVGDASNYSPFTFDLTAGTIASGAYVTMNVKPSAQTELSSTSYIERNWELHQSGISGSYSYDVDYTYLDGDIVGTEADFLESKVSSGTLLQGSSVNASTNTVSWTGLTSFSYFGARDLDDGGGLPIDLLSFSGKMVEENIMLSWQTVSETNNDYFSIEQSVNGVDFEEIGIQKGMGNSNTIMDYSFVDKNPLSGINYYRLKQVDFDGSFDYSNVISVDNIFSELKLWPNPVHSNTLNISLPEVGNRNIEISIFNITGQKIIVQKKQNINSLIKIDVSSLQDGVYFIEVNSGTEMIRKKFQVLK